MRQIVLATRNPHKIDELRQILAGIDVVVRGIGEFDGAGPVVEDGLTFEENAAKKAEAAAAATCRLSLADDSGLVVDELGGAPGVISARYAGGEGDHVANNAKLLAAMSGVPDGRRTARFVCVIAVARTGRQTALFRGESGGSILCELRGTGGFGYDPLFYSPELGMSFAEAGPDRKHAVSHRGRALAKFRRALREGQFDGWF